MYKANHNSQNLFCLKDNYLKNNNYFKCCIIIIIINIK